MSRIGKQPVVLPAGVTATLSDGNISVKGPKGELGIALPPGVTVAQEEGMLRIEVGPAAGKGRDAIWGLSQRLITNLVLGVTQGFSKQLEINGVGYRAAVSGSTLNLSLGYSHPIAFAIPKGITITVEKNLLTVSGIDKQLVGQVSADIRSLRAPEPYKGKGIKYVTEVIARKAGKTAAKAAA